MAQILESPSIRFLSGPHRLRAGTLPLCVGLGLVMAYCVSVLWVVVAYNLFAVNIYIALILSTSIVGFLLFSTLMARAVIKDMTRRYELEVNPSELVVTSYDRGGKGKSIMILLGDITYAEYYSWTSMIVHTDYKTFEVPLWPLGNRSRDLVDYLIGHGVNVIDIEEDGELPES